MPLFHSIFPCNVFVYIYIVLDSSYIYTIYSVCIAAPIPMSNNNAIVSRESS